MCIHPRCTAPHRQLLLTHLLQTPVHSSPDITNSIWWTPLPVPYCAILRCGVPVPYCAILCLSRTVPYCAVPCCAVPCCPAGHPCVVVSPLIALMEDQVAALTARGVQAALLGSAQTNAEVGEVQRGGGGGGAAGEHNKDHTHTAANVSDG
jgi:hypothetical protein